MGDLRLNEISYSNNGTGVLMLNGVNYTGGVVEESTGFDLKFSNGTAGSSTFTIDETGVYLLLTVYSLNGSGSITLPAGRTASYTGSVLISNAKGMVITVAELQRGDVVTMETSVSSWVANTKAVIKIPTAVTTLVDSATAGDTDISYTLSTGSGEVLCVATAWARLLRVDNIYDISDITNNMIAGIVDTNVYLRIFACDASDFPTIRMYGYDGGGVAIAVLQ